MYFEKFVDIDGMSSLVLSDPDTFTLGRRNGFGASDSSILIGVNHWTKLEELIAQKNSTEITDEEREISNKPQVRMGNICEPGILEAFNVWSGLKAEKPDQQYRLHHHPVLTVNYDGIVYDGDNDFCPVECKYVSTWARKYWDWSRAFDSFEQARKQRAINYDGIDVVDIVMNESLMLGIPPYYYTQCQQQMLGVRGKRTYLCACDSKEGLVKFFVVPENERVQKAIIDSAEYALELCKNMQEYLHTL